MKHYWQARHDLTIGERLLLYQSRIVVPETLCKIHQGHQGIQRCRLQVTSEWWPGVSTQMEELVKKCSTCMYLSPPVREPMIPSPLPTYPWEKVTTDLFEFQGQHYLLFVDYFSQYPEVIRVHSTTSASVISAMKSVFSKNGIPSTIVGDNGPQYNSAEMKACPLSYGFKHITSSPHYPQSNSQAERTVKTVKGLLQDSPDIFLSLLSYHATFLPWCGLSPGELLMGRQLRTDVPETKRLLTTNWLTSKGLQRTRR